MIILNYKNQLYKYFLYISVLLVSLFIIVNVFYKEPVKVSKEVKTSLIEYTDEVTEINVEYPRFKDDTINKITTATAIIIIFFFFILPSLFYLIFYLLFQFLYQLIH